MHVWEVSEGLWHQSARKAASEIGISFETFGEFEELPLLERPRRLEFHPVNVNLNTNHLHPSPSCGGITPAGLDPHLSRASS